ISGSKFVFSLEYPCHSPVERRWFKLIVTPLLKEYPSDVVVMHLNITDRIETEQKLHESEQHYKSLFENHPDAICSMDLAGNFSSVNAILATNIGLPAWALLHQPLVSFLPPENQKDFQYFFRQACKGKPQNFEVTIHTWKVKPMAVNITNIPIKINGQITGVFSIIKDITAKRRAQKLLVESAQRLNTLLDSITDGFFMIDHRFIITYLNKEAEKLLDVKREEIMGKNLWEIFPVEEESKYFSEYHKALRENVPVHFEELYAEKDLWTEVNAYPSKEGLSIYFKVINERKNAEESLLKYTIQLEKINSELDQFVYRTSHDLRAPLVSILGLIDIAQEERSETQKNEYLRLMAKSVRKLDKFILDIIHYSKNARTDIVMSEIDFGWLVKEALDDLKYMDESQAIAIRTHIEALPGFYSDQMRLSVILNNIIANAIRYHDPTKEQPYISISIRKEVTGIVNITIEDNGQGIADKHQIKIFEMFYRANANNVGSGLGLYIVKESLKKLKGSIHVNSKLGQGTTFTILLPNLHE
ncbi:MAG: PAS domain-containing sensor histidine kinase, partial [Bacteroidota bacterium]